MKNFIFATVLATVACLTFTADSEATGRLRFRQRVVVERVVVQRQVFVQQQVFVPTFAVVQPVFTAQVVVPVQPLVTVQPLFISPVVVGVCH